MLETLAESSENAAVVGAMRGWLDQRPPTENQRTFLGLAAARLGAADPVPLAALKSLSPPARTAAMQWLLALTCFGEKLADEELQTLEGLNRELNQPTPWPKALRYGRDGRTRLATLALGRWSPDAKAMMRVLWKDGGLFAVLGGMLSAVGKSPSNAKLAADYAALEKLPPGTMGWAFFEHMRSRKLPMPGEKGGLPERAMHHDLMHLLSGFDTDARGEGRLAALYAGMTSRHRIEGADPFAFIMVGLMTFHLGHKVGPTFVGAETGVVDPGEMLALIRTGQSVTINVLTEWNFRDDFARPLTEVRERLGLPREGALQRAAV